MKKFVSIVLAMILVLSMSVVALAEEVLFTYEVKFPEEHGWWKDDQDFKSNADFIAALQTEGAKVVVKADAAVADGAEGHGFQYGIQETVDDWGNVLCHSNFANGEGAIGADSAIVDGDYSYITFDAAAFLAACEANGVSTESWQWINGAAAGKTYSISVIVPDAPAAETTAPAAETNEPAAETAPAADETSEPANTGIVLALLPMAVAAAAVVVSKRK